jgi:hypothetical protein
MILPALPQAFSEPNAQIPAVSIIGRPGEGIEKGEDWTLGDLQGLI